MIFSIFDPLPNTKELTYFDYASSQTMEKSLLGCVGDIGIPAIVYGRSTIQFAY